MILTKIQAWAVADSIQSIGKAGGIVSINFTMPIQAGVYEYDTGSIHVIKGMGGPGNSEIYEDLKDFISAYDL